MIASMFTKRHEQELAEIKALTHELGKRFEEIVEQLGRIQAAQDQLAAQRQPVTRDGLRGSEAVDALDGETTESKPRAKKARRRQAPNPDAVAAGGKSGKRRTKATKAGGAGKRRDAGAGSDEG
jgi:hypothetical protein